MNDRMQIFIHKIHCLQTANYQVRTDLVTVICVKGVQILHVILQVFQGI